MIQDFIKKLDSRKDLLRDHLKTCKTEDISYRYLVEKIFDIVLNDSDDFDFNKFDTKSMTVIDGGDYRGTQIFIVPEKTYQPSVEDYVMTHNYYGSCPGCDTLLGILGYEDNPTDDQVDGLMTLCLHLIQKMKRLSDED